jgi:hypothetical protein
MFVWNMVNAVLLIPALSHFLLRGGEAAAREAAQAGVGSAAAA